MYSLLEVLVGSDGDAYIERDALHGAEAASGRDDARSTLMAVCDGGSAMADQRWRSSDGGAAMAEQL